MRKGKELDLNKLLTELVEIKKKLFNANVSEDIEWQVVMILGLMFKGQVRPEVI